MAKAMLIMDMPNKCHECQCAYITLSERECMAMDLKAIDVDVKNEKPTWCPLREVPSKHEKGHCLKVAIENDCYDDTVQDDAWCEGYDKGYNACIDEMLGGGE